MIRNIYVGDAYSRKVTTPLITTDNNSYKITWDTKENSGVFKITAIRDDESSVVDFGELSEKGVATYIMKNEMYAIEGNLTLYLAICEDQAVVTCREIKFTVKKGADENEIAQENVNPINALAMQVAKINSETDTKINNLQATGMADAYILQIDEDITVADGVVTEFIKNDYSEYEAIAFPEGITEIRLPDMGGETHLVANKVIMPKSLKTIGDSSFANRIMFDENDKVVEGTVVVNVKEYVLNDGLETIEQYAFSDNIYLERINIPESVKVIGQGAFLYSDRLEKIVIPATVTEIGDANFVSSSFKAEDSTIIYGYAGSEAERYAVNTNYGKSFENVFVNIGSDYRGIFNNSSNALKDEVFGEVVNINDISPIEHPLSVKVLSKNLINWDKWTLNNCTREGEIIKCEIDNAPYSEIYIENTAKTHSFFNVLKENKGKKLTFSMAEALPGRYMIIAVKYLDKDGITYPVRYTQAKNSNKVSILLAEDLDIVSIGLQFNIKEDLVNHTDMETTVSADIQLEFGEATEYKPYVSNVNETKVIIYDSTGEAKEYIPNEDGMIEGVKSSYPSMTMESSIDGVLIDCKYNRDINSKIESVDDINQKNTESLKTLHQNKLRDVYRAKALGGDVDDDVAIQNYIDEETYVYLPALPDGKAYRLKKPLVIKKYGTVIQGEGFGFKTLIVPENEDVSCTVYDDKEGKNKTFKTLIYVEPQSGNSMMFTIRDVCFRTYTSHEDKEIPNQNYEGTCIASNVYIIDSKIENCWFNGGSSTIKNGVENTKKARISSTAISLNAIHTIISGCWFECFDTAIHLGKENDEKNRQSNGYLITNCDFWSNLNAIETSGRGAVRNCHFSSMQGGFAVRAFNDCLVHVSDCTAWLSRPVVVDKTNDDTLLFAREGAGKVVIAEDTSHLIVRGLSVNETTIDDSAYNVVFSAKGDSSLIIKDCDMYVDKEKINENDESLTEMPDAIKIESESTNCCFELEFKEIPENLMCAPGSKIYFSTPKNCVGAVYTADGWEEFGGKYSTLKGSKSGETVAITDVSSVEHNLSVQLSSKNLVDLSKWVGSRCVINNNDGTVTCNINNYNYAEIYTTKLNDFLLEHKGETITFSIAEIFDNRNIAIIINGRRADGSVLTVVPVKLNSNVVSAVISEEFATITEVMLRFNWKGSSVHTDTTSTVSNIQLEFGDKTEYAPFVADFSNVKLSVTENEKVYKPGVDGKVKGVKSVYPVTTLVADTPGVLIECKYNRDLNKAFEELQNAILSLGNAENVN